MAGDTPAGQVLALVTGLVDAAQWLYGHWYLLAPAIAVCWGVVEMVVRLLAAKASAERMALELVATRHFDPSLVEIFRRGVALRHATGRIPAAAARKEQTHIPRTLRCALGEPPTAA
ncbi:hypothetical protein ABZ468_20155 [Streptomyces sp. NPDC005708]|uniref:hypothetical protein n=1 Tax=Streptomyces sp. NPDC005708 TaxID=3154564 RepID=UPI0033ED0927